MSGGLKLPYLHKCCCQMPRGTFYSMSLSYTFSLTHTHTQSHTITHTLLHVHLYMCVLAGTHMHVAPDCNESSLIVSRSWNFCLSRHICGTEDLADQAHFCTNHNIISGSIQYAVPFSELFSGKREWLFSFFYLFIFYFPGTRWKKTLNSRWNATRFFRHGTLSLQVIFFSSGSLE